jgi:hypothetical protein
MMRFRWDTINTSVRSVRFSRKRNGLSVFTLDMMRFFIRRNEWMAIGTIRGQIAHCGNHRQPHLGIGQHQWEHEWQEAWFVK